MKRVKIDITDKTIPVEMSGNEIELRDEQYIEMQKTIDEMILEEVAKIKIPEAKKLTKQEIQEALKPFIPQVDYSSIIQEVVRLIPKPKDGESFDFEKLTLEQKNQLVGPPGSPGVTVRLKDIYKGAYEAGRDYTTDWIVTYNGGTYFALKSNRNVTPGTDSTVWQVLVPDVQADIDNLYALIHSLSGA